MWLKLIKVYCSFIISTINGPADKENTLISFNIILGIGIYAYINFFLPNYWKIKFQFKNICEVCTYNENISKYALACETVKYAKYEKTKYYCKLWYYEIDFYNTKLCFEWKLENMQTPIGRQP